MSRLNLIAPSGAESSRQGRQSLPVHAQFPMLLYRIEGQRKIGAQPIECLEYLRIEMGRKGFVVSLEKDLTRLLTAERSLVANSTDLSEHSP